MLWTRKVAASGENLDKFFNVADEMVVQLWPVSVTQRYACDRERDRKKLKHRKRKANKRAVENPTYFLVFRMSHQFMQ